MKLFLSLLLTFTTSALCAQTKTFTGTSTRIWPNQYKDTLTLDGKGTNTMTVNNTNAVTSDTVLARFQQQGTNQFRITQGGRILIGNGANDEGIQNYESIYSVFDESLGDPAANRWRLRSKDSSAYNYYGQIDMQTGTSNTNAPSASVVFVSVGGAGQYGELDLYGTAGNRVIGLYDGNGTTSAITPDSADGSTIAKFGSSLAHTSGNLLEVPNFGTLTNGLQVAFDGAITTGDPIGGTAGAVKFGKVVTGVTVGLIITNYVNVTVDGVALKFALVQ